MVNPINNLQLQQEQLIFQYFSGFDAIQDRPITTTRMSLPYLVELYLRYNKTTMTYTDFADLARLCRYILTELKGKIKYPIYDVRWKLTYDYSLVPAFNATIQTRTGKILFNPTTNSLFYRFVVATTPNSPVFDVYLDSAFTVVDIPITFSIDSQDFSAWLPTSRFLDQRTTLESWADTNLTLADILDYESFDLSQFENPNDYVIKYLSDSLELFESLI
jgi:hypothetical protein